MGVVLAVKPGGGGGRVELVEPLAVEVAVEPDTDESEQEKMRGEGWEGRGIMKQRSLKVRTCSYMLMQLV